MGRPPCCDQDKGVRKGPWLPEEDDRLTAYINENGCRKWRSLPKLAGLNRCGKSCRLRWMNYLRPDIRRGKFSDEEESTIVRLHALLGNKWSKIATHLPGRTDNEIKNYWNTHMRKRLLQMGIDPITHEPRSNHLSPLLDISQMLATAISSSQLGNSNLLNQNTSLEDLVKLQLIYKMLQIITPKTVPNINSYNTSSLDPKPEAGGIHVNTIEPLVFMSQTASEDFMPSFEEFWDGIEDDQLPGLITISQDNLNSTKPGMSTTTEGSDQTGASMMPVYYGDDHLRELRLSGLVPVSPEPSGLNCPGTAQHFSGSDVLQDLEKFLDVETSDSCWKSFLDLTSPTSSPVPWW